MGIERILRGPYLARLTSVAGNERRMTSPPANENAQSDSGCRTQDPVPRSRLPSRRVAVSGAPPPTDPSLWPLASGASIVGGGLSRWRKTRRNHETLTSVEPASEHNSDCSSGNTMMNIHTKHTSRCAFVYSRSKRSKPKYSPKYGARDRLGTYYADHIWQR